MAVPTCAEPLWRCVASLSRVERLFEKERARIVNMTGRSVPPEVVLDPAPAVYDTFVKVC